jgi:hypothetical protein
MHREIMATTITKPITMQAGTMARVPMLKSPQKFVFIHNPVSVSMHDQDLLHLQFVASCYKPPIFLLSALGWACVLS